MALDGQQEPQAPSNDLDHIQNALSANLDPRVSNDIRQEALQYLEAVKSAPDAPMNGFTLAANKDQNDAVRYFGLQLLEFGVKYRWTDYSEEQQDQLRDWLSRLAVSVQASDALFLRNKISQLWAEVAKRCWAGEWMDMDELLNMLWSQTEDQHTWARKLFVLHVLETLSEDIMNNEDTTAGLRLDLLAPALNEIVTSADAYREHASARGNTKDVRHSDPGWLSRICDMFSTAVKEAEVARYSAMASTMQICALKALTTVRSIMSWITLQAVHEVHLVDCLFLPFHTGDVALQTATVESLLALACRSTSTPFYWCESVRQMLRSDRIPMLQHWFEQHSSSPGEDDEKYTFQKKLAELVSVMADAIASNYSTIVDKSVDLPAFYSLLLSTLQHNSLAVSIPALHSWTKQLAVQETHIMDLVLAAFPALIQTCSRRLLRYEALPADFEDETLQFLIDDFDTIPERHAFLGNYRRYCTDVIQSITQAKPIDALSHILGELHSLLQHGPYAAARGFDVAGYSRTSPSVLRYDAQHNVAVSALKGYSSWCWDMAGISHSDPVHSQADSDQQMVASSLQEWCNGIVNISIDDPSVADQVIELIVQIVKILRPAPPHFVLQMTQHILSMQLNDTSAKSAFSEVISSFEHLRMVQLQRLAVAFPTDLLAVYQELEARVQSLNERFADDSRLVWGYQGFLFMIMHRATGIDDEIRMAKLEKILEPIYQAWTNASLTASLATMETFMETIGLDGIPRFYQEHDFGGTQEWSAQELADDGMKKQNEIKQRVDQLPLRMTKTMLGATCDKLKDGSDEYDIAVRLWSGLIPLILPHLLQMIRHASAYSNMNNWSYLPPQAQELIQRTLQDRFWQSGISNETKDEFYARVSGSRTSYEGFASTVRGTIRNIREYGYHILYWMTKFDDSFYGVEDFAAPLATALFSDVPSLGTNHLTAVISLTTGLVSRCPPQRRIGFLEPVLREMIFTFDAKINHEWTAIAQTASQTKNETDELSDEMRTESILRQLTYSMVNFIQGLLKVPIPTTIHQVPQDARSADQHREIAISDLVLSSPGSAHALTAFCCHALRWHDIRCCQAMCKVMRIIVPRFVLFADMTRYELAMNSSTGEAWQTTIAGTICGEALPACIESLHEPYFADCQRDLASLITQILVLYSPKWQVPSKVLCRLPNMDSAKVDTTIQTLLSIAHKSERSQRSLVLQLLESVRGISIHEAGKIDRSREVEAAKKKKQSVPQQYMQVDKEPAGRQDADNELDGLATMFGSN